MPESVPLLRKLVEADNETKAEARVCPLRALAYTVAGVPNRVEEPVCIGERCAWYVQSCECCAVKMFAVP